MVMTEWPHFVLDTNVVLYLLGNRVAEPLPSGSYVLSIISEMELLSYPNLSETEEQQIRNFLGQLQIIGLSHRVKTTAIDLRKQHGIKLPDAIISATALTLDATLLTNDSRLVKLRGVGCVRHSRNAPSCKALVRYASANTPYEIKVGQLTYPAKAVN